jgi:hypothetical protein
VVDFHKCACKNQEFKSKKRFTIFILKIKEAFTVKLKMISVDYYFRTHQIPKNAENIFQKTFYAEINGALIVFNLQHFGCLIPLVMTLTFSFMTFTTHSRVYIFGVQNVL